VREEYRGRCKTERKREKKRERVEEIKRYLKSEREIRFALLRMQLITFK
jgi:hypothetical protein